MKTRKITLEVPSFKKSNKKSSKQHHCSHKKTSHRSHDSKCCHKHHHSHRVYASEAKEESTVEEVSTGTDGVEVTVDINEKDDDTNDEVNNSHNHHSRSSKHHHSSGGSKCTKKMRSETIDAAKHAAKIARSYSGRPSVTVQYNPPELAGLEYTDGGKRNMVAPRAAKGWVAVAHVHSVASNRERTFGDHWDKYIKQAANSVCAECGIDIMYPDIDLKDVQLPITEFNINGPIYRPIITESMFKEAEELFGDIHQNDDASLDGTGATSTEGEAEPVEVMDVEEKVKEDNPPKVEGEVVKEVPTNDPATMIAAGAVISVAPDGSATVETPPVQEEKPAEESKTEEAKSEGDKPKDEKVVNFTVRKDDKSNKVSPIVFDNDKLNIYRNETKDATDDQKRIFAQDLGPAMQKAGITTYDLRASEWGALYVEYNVNGMREGRHIDPNIYVSNGYNVIGSMSRDGKVQNIPVNCAEVDTCAKIFATPVDEKTGYGYILTPDEVSKAMDYLFGNTDIYMYIDMTGMKKHITKLQPDEFKKLGKKLSFIINAFSDDDRGRYKFEYFDSIDSFGLVSDESVRYPFKDESSPMAKDNINPEEWKKPEPTNVNIVVSGDDVIFVSKARKSHRLKITDYNVI